MSKIPAAIPPRSTRSATVSQLLLDRAKGDSPQEVVSDEKGEDPDGKNEEQSTGGDLRPGDAVRVALQSREIHGNGDRLRVVEGHGEPELVPRRDETENRGHSHPRARVRNDDAKECP